MNAPEALAHAPDSVWREMRLHMEWSSGLSLCFLFSDSAAAVAPIRQWADDAWQWRTAPLLFVEPADAAGAADTVLAALERQRARLPDTRAPVWLQMLAADIEGTAHWDAARAQCLAALNQGREWLVRDLARPLVLCLPAGWRTRVGQIAPDLWHVRAFTAAVVAPTTPPLPASPSAAPKTIAEATAAMLDGPQRLLTNARARHAADDRPGIARELALALDAFGEACQAAGRGNAALTAYRESLMLSRQLHEALGDDPQVLRDLSVSLNNVGDAEREAGRGDAALMAYRESVALARQLREALGDGPQVLDDVAVSLERIAASTSADLAERRAAAAEAVALRKRMVSAMPDSHRHRQRLSVVQRIADGLTGALPAPEYEAAQQPGETRS